MRGGRDRVAAADTSASQAATATVYSRSVGRLRNIIFPERIAAEEAVRTGLAVKVADVQSSTVMPEAESCNV